MGNKFKEITNRDAWSTIRGFVYQVDTTIIRWLDLAEDEVLELEKGEDIDLIKEGIEDKDQLRILEQVKYRDSTLSLNTELALELLFNFFNHKQNNPGHKLLFRFVSNAGYNIERPALFQKGQSGIEVWQEIFSEENVSKNDNRIQIIKNHLLRKITEKIIDPSKIEEKDKAVQKLWVDFKALVNDHESFLQFIKAFEWSLESVDSDNISDAVKNKILTSKHMPSNIDVEKVYSRLFMFVFKLLTTSSSKRLDIETLKSESSLPALSTQDETIFIVITELLDSLKGRVQLVESQMVTTLAQIQALTEEISEVKSSDAVFEIQLKNLTLAQPAILRNGSTRAVRTNALIESFKSKPWVNFQGINATGKTQLALLTCQLIENVYWIELREYNSSPEKSALYIEAVLEHISGVPLENNRRNWISKIFRELPENCIIVINDLPRIENTGRLKNLLTDLATNLPIKQIRLLTTSNYNIPNHVTETLTTNVFHEFTDFTFSDEEVLELLTKNGAPESVLKYADLFASVSHRNPQILSTIVKRLVIMNWGKDSVDVFEELFNKEFSREIFRDAQSAITKFVTDGQMKELLYRLSLIHWGYNFDIVRAVSEAETKIESPYEKLQGITNTWIQESGTIYKTSPLIHDLGVDNLSQQTKKSTYAAIANAILKFKSLDLVSASRVITSFIKAENYNEAGIILLSLMRRADNENGARSLYDWGYLSYWTETEIPSEMSNSIKSHILLDQIRLRKIIGKDTDMLQKKLDTVVEKIKDVEEKTITLIFILANEAARTLKQYLEYTKFILENTSSLPEPIKEAFSNELLEGLIWMPLQQVETEEDVASWLLLPEIFENTTGNSFYQNEITETGLTVLAAHIVKFERNKHEFSSKKLLKRLDQLVEFFYSKGFEGITAAFLKEKCALLFFELNDPIKAEQLTVEWIEKFTTPMAKYLLTENLGKLYYNKEKDPESSIWLEKAIEYNCETHATFPDTLAYGAASKSDVDNSTAVVYMERAVNLTMNTPWLTELDLVQMLCELGIAYWKNNDYYKSYNTFNDALLRLQSEKNQNFGAYWIRLTSWLAHTLGYISADVAKDDIPLHFRNGADYTKPYQGIFLFNTQDLSDIYSPNKDVLVLAQMAIFSEGVGDLEEAYKWSLRAFDEARKTGDENLVKMVLIACNQYSLLNYKFDEHFEMAMQFHAITAHTNGTPEERYQQAATLDYGEIFKAKPSVEWDSAEETLITMSILPMVIMVLNSHNEGEYKNDSDKKLLSIVKDYALSASNKSIWDDLYKLTSKIFDRSLTVEFLTKEGNKYGELESKNFQAICILGSIFLERNTLKSLLQIINVFPYFTKNFSNMPGMSRNIFVPFVKKYVIKAIKENFVGSKVELAEIIDQVEITSVYKTHAVQKLLLLTEDVCDLVIQGDRKEWLHNFKEI